MTILYEYRGAKYPEYLRGGNAMQFLAPFAAHFCKGRGLDVGCGKWPLPGAVPVDLANGGDAMALPDGPWDYIVSSHCLEHLRDPVAALEHWQSRLRPGGVLLLYLPHPDMVYWRPQWCRKHRHSWQPRAMAELLRDLGFVDVINGERDLAWSFAVVGHKAGEPAAKQMPADVPPLNGDHEPIVGDITHGAFANPLLKEVLRRFGKPAFARSSACMEFEAFLRRIRGARRDGVCLEIGTYHGISALVLSQFFERVVCVSVDEYPEKLMKRQIVEALGVTNIEFHDVPNNAGKRRIVDALAFDFCYSDGDHVNDTRADWELVRRCGRVLFHEAWPIQAPVWNLCHSLPADEVTWAEHDCFAYWQAKGG